MDFINSYFNFSMSGALNKLPIAILGMLYFKDPVTVGGVSAIFVGNIT